jgi:hypothetical protein
MAAITGIESSHIQAGTAELNDPASSAPDKLKGAWLRFHELEYCQDIDAVFEFRKDGMEVWTSFEDEKRHQKFLDILDPLRSSYRIDVYATRQPEAKPLDRDDLPASLWENAELRAYLEGAKIPAKIFGDPDILYESKFDYDREILKVRMLIFSENILEWNRKMERYATDLPALVGVSLDGNAAPALRTKAMLICLAHAQNLVKYVTRLNKNIKNAFPKYSPKQRTSKQSRTIIAGSFSVDCAVQLSVEAQSVARRVYRFINPKSYTVGLDELREPGLPQALNTLEKRSAEFLKTVTMPEH